MSRRTARLVAPLALVVLLLGSLGTGCASVGRGIQSVGEGIENNPKTSLGGAIGAIGGGLIGYAAGGGAAGIIGGVLLGGLLGGAAGNALDGRDKELASRNAQQSLESARTGSSSTWHNPDSGASGNFTPTRTYQQADGRYCREYTQTIMVGGEKHQGHGTACREPDGSWQIQS